MNSTPLRKLSTRILVASLFVFAGISHAQSVKFSDSNKTIALLGVQGTTHYMRFNENLSQNCEWGNIYISPEYKSMYAQALGAKLAGKKLSRIDYVQPGGSGTVCTAILIEITD